MILRRGEGALRVLLQFARAQSAGDPYGFHFEAQDYVLLTVGGASPTARFEWTADVLANLEAVRRPGRDPVVVQRMGERLRGFVLAAGWAEWERQIAQAVAEQRPVFLTIRSSAAELYALPWELLTLKSGQFIGEVDGLLLRYEWPESESAPEQPTPRPEGGRILVAWSAAAGAVPASEHVEAIATACEAGFHRFDRSTDVLAQASLQQLVHTLEQAAQSVAPIAVLHLLCHGAEAGGTFGLALDGSPGPVVVDPTQLRQQLAPFAKQVRLVVLSACDSGNAGALGNQLGSISQALHRCGFQAVIASRFPLSVAGSSTLTQSFYHALLSGPASLETAFLTARKRLAQAETDLPLGRRPLDWASVQLYAHQTDGEDARPVVFRPFRGLLAFQPEHRRFFFGRDKEVQEVLTDLQALVDSQKPRILVVAGASGTGKSSLVLAGAVPKLLAANPQLALLKMRPGSDPCAALDAALSVRPTDAAALLVVDQFEEIFTQTTAPAARDRFARRLWSLASAPDSGLCIVLTLRVDFIGRCGELVLDDAGLRLDSVAYDEPHRVFVAQPGADQLRAAVIEPAHRVGLELEAGLADRIVYEVGAEPGALPLLEDALDVLWQHRTDRTLAQGAYDTLGGVVGALQKRADAVVDRLPPHDQLLAQRLLVSLVAVADDTALDSRLRVSVTELRQSMAAEDAARFERVLKDLVDARLLVLDEDRQAPTVEVAHEALIRKWAKLRAWLDEDRAGLVIQRRVKQIAQQWQRQKHDDSLLYRGTQLAQATEWRKTWEPRLGDLDRRFLDASEALRIAEVQQGEERLQKERARARQTRIAAAVLGVLFVGAALAGLLAKQKSDESYATLLLAIAQNLKQDPTAATTLLREPGHQASSLWIESALDALKTEIAETVLRGHSSAVSSVAFSPDGKKIVTGSEDHSARIWNADGSGAPVVLQGHTSSVGSVAFSPDGKKIVTGSEDHSARIWNADGSGAPVVLQGHASYVHSVAFSPDGKKIVTGSWDKTARVWNADGSGTPVVLQGHADPVHSVAFSPDGKKIVTGSRDKTARIWNADGSGTPAVLQGHTSSVASVAFSPDGKKIVTGSWDRTARIWNADGSGTPVMLQGHAGSVSSVTFSPDGKRIVTSSWDKTARIWNADGSETPAVLQGHTSGVVSVAFSPDGKKIVSGSDDHTARIWNADRSAAHVVLQVPRSDVTSVAFSPDGKKIVTGSRDKTARIWNADGSGEPILLIGHESEVASVALSPDGRKIVTGSDDHTARVWNANGTGTPLALRGHESYVTSVAFSPDGKRIVTGSGDKTAHIWNADGSGIPVVLRGHESYVTSVAFSPDGKKIVTGSGDKTARIWNADGLGTPIVLQGHTSRVYSVAFSPDGKKVVTAEIDDRTARIWDADGSGTPIVLQGHTDSVHSVAFSPDGKKIVTGSGDKTARIWDADGSGVPVVLQGHTSDVQSVAFSPDGKKVVTGSGDKTARIWIVASDVLLESLWNATSDCLPERRRQELLAESAAEAKQRYARCRQEVARRRGWAAP